MRRDAELGRRVREARELAAMAQAAEDDAEFDPPEVQPGPPGGGPPPEANWLFGDAVRRMMGSGGGGGVVRRRAPTMREAAVKAKLARFLAGMRAWERQQAGGGGAASSSAPPQLPPMLAEFCVWAGEMLGGENGGGGDGSIQETARRYVSGRTGGGAASSSAAAADDDCSICQEGLSDAVACDELGERGGDAVRPPLPRAVLRSADGREPRRARPAVPDVPQRDRAPCASRDWRLCKVKVRL